MANAKFRITFGVAAIAKVKSGELSNVPGTAMFQGNLGQHIFTEATGAVMSFSVERHSMTKLESTAQVSFWDPKAIILASLPDPEYFRTPVLFEVTRESDPNGRYYAVFEGYITTLEGDALPPRQCHITCHDKTFKMRTTSRLKTYRNLTGPQLVKKVAADYGLDTDIDTGGFSPTVFMEEIALTGRTGTFTDYDQLDRALREDGLEMWIEPGTDTLTVRYLPKSSPRKIKVGVDPLISMKCRESYIGDGTKKVGGGGYAAGQSTKAVDEKGNPIKQQTNDVEATTTTTGAAGVPKATDDAHNRQPMAPQLGKKAKKRAHKNELDVVGLSMPDIGLDTRVDVDSGLGTTHYDGLWYARRVRHDYVSTGQMTTSTFTFTRSGAEQASKVGNGGYAAGDAPGEPKK